MLRTAVGELVRAHFALFDVDGFTPLSGKTDGDFSKTLIVDGALSVLPMTVTEVGTTGVYYMSFTPDAAGRWYAQAVEPSDTECVFDELVDVAGLAQIQLNATLDENTNEILIDAWLERDTQRIVDPTSVSIEVFDRGDVSLGTATSSSSNSDGVFRLTIALLTALPGDRTYYVKASIVDSRGTVNNHHGMST